MPKKVKTKQNISVNTGEPIVEEKDLDLNPLGVLSDDAEENDDDEGLGLDDEEVDPFGDKWEQ